ncbi:MAG: FG-GAP-like repeat-containing protein [Cyanobacteria bacterium P01_A01_bin.84]
MLNKNIKSIVPASDLQNATDLLGTSAIKSSSSYPAAVAENGSSQTLTAGGSVSYAPDSPGTQVAPNLTISDADGDLNAARVIIDGFKSGDVLSITGKQNGSITVGGVSYTLEYDETSGVLKIDGQASEANYQEALRAVTFSTTSDDTSSRNVQFSLGNNLANPENNNFYEFVSSDGISWTDAKAAAESKSYFGLKGYLATITSQEEQDFIEDKVQGNGWIGASDDTNQGSSGEGDWRWVTGPEAGTQFWSGNGLTGNAVNSAYQNWKQVKNLDNSNDASQVEPNNNNNNENYAHIIGDTTAGELGKWNDLNNTETASGFKPQGYIVEYGGLSGETTPQITGSVQVNISSDTVQPGESKWKVIAVDDFDADGKDDIVWRNEDSGEIGLWRMDGTNVLKKQTIATVGLDTGWVPVDVGDVDGDNKADFIWRNSNNGNNGIWTMSSSDTIKEQFQIEAVADLDWKIVAVGDVGGDGKADLVWRHASNGNNGIWEMDGKNILTQNTLLQVEDTNWTIVDAADFGGDGKADLLWHNNTTGGNAIWEMDGSNVLNYLNIDTVADTNYKIVGTGDFGGNGKANIAWRNNSTGKNAIWEQDGGTSTSQFFVDDLNDSDWNIVGVGDFNGNGNSELLWRTQKDFNSSNNAIWEIDVTAAENEKVSKSTFIDKVFEV